MLVRLAFSVMIQVDADDPAHRRGARRRRRRLPAEVLRRVRPHPPQGATVLLVTHDMGAVERFCDRAILLERGHVVEIGEPEHVGEPLPGAELRREGARGRGEEAEVAPPAGRRAAGADVADAR